MSHFGCRIAYTDQKSGGILLQQHDVILDKIILPEN